MVLLPMREEIGGRTWCSKSEPDITNAYLLESSVDQSETTATNTGTAIYRNQLLSEYKETVLGRGLMMMGWDP